MEKTKIPFSKQAAIASFWMPFIVIGINIGISIPHFVTSRTGNLIVGSFFAFLYCLGFIFGIIALFGIRKHGKKGILGRATAGVIINGLILIFFIYITGMTRKVKSFAEPYTEAQLRAMPDVIAGSTSLIHPELGLKIEIPPEFIKNPLEQPQAENLIDSYIKKYDDNTILMINIKYLNGTIGREPLNINDIDKTRYMLPANAIIRIRNELWGKYNISVLHVQYPVGDNVFVVYTSQVPLVQRAIQLEIGGSLARENEIYQTLQQVMSGLRGKSNWDLGVGRELIFK